MLFEKQSDDAPAHYQLQSSKKQDQLNRPAEPNLGKPLI
jgi:hypothetical protein